MIVLSHANVQLVKVQQCADVFRHVLAKVKEIKRVHDLAFLERENELPALFLLIATEYFELVYSPLGLDILQPFFPGVVKLERGLLNQYWPHVPYELGSAAHTELLKLTILCFYDDVFKPYLVKDVHGEEHIWGIADEHLLEIRDQVEDVLG